MCCECGLSVTSLLYLAYRKSVFSPPDCSAGSVRDTFRCHSALYLSQSWPLSTAGLCHFCLNDELSIYTLLLYVCAVRKSKPLKTWKFVRDGGNNLFTLFKLKKGEYTKKNKLNDISDSVSVTSLCSLICVSLWMQPDSAGPEGLQKQSQVAELSAQPHPTGRAWRFYSIRMLPATTPPHPPAVVKSNS